jgi:hypothetical protein
MPRTRTSATVTVVVVLLGLAYILHAAGGGYTLVGWNNLGMHCMDSDYSVFSILPPYNTIYAQLIDRNGRLVRNPFGIEVTYEAVRDPDGSINSTSIGKTNFWQFVSALFGAAPAIDVGLTGSMMPGSGNRPMPTLFDSSTAAFVGEGIPITPYDDSGKKNYYPLLHLVARDSAGAILAATDVVAPVSDEMDCRACHASDSADAARPAAGWVRDLDPERDYRLNILRLHDELNASNPGYNAALAKMGYETAGLYPTVTGRGRPILCAGCHLSNALPGTGIAGITPLTQAVHGGHAGVVDPVSGQTLNGAGNRTACYRCHPGSETRCLRGVMGSAVSADGALAMQCQSCHGTMSSVGASVRQGWLSEPACQSCHTGTATQNSGAIRYSSSFDSSGHTRSAANSAFATTPNTPVAGASLFRLSTGHGGLYCSACHGSTHAEFPATHQNDNLQNLRLQGAPGVLADCSVCHNTQPNTVNGGPHGMHPVGQQWVNGHGDVAERSSAQCQACHGPDYRGTVLSRSLGNRTFSTKFGVRNFWRGFQVGCYACHRGPSSESSNSNRQPVASNTSVLVTSAIPRPIVLTVSDPDGNSVTTRVVSQPAHGTVSINGSQANYFPETGYAGPDSFTYAAWDGSVDSNLATVSLQVVKKFYVPFYQQSDSSYTGLAFTNNSDQAAHLELTAFGSDGRRLALPQNPATITLSARGQSARLASEIFGGGAAVSAAWIEVSSDNGDTGCFFQFGGTGRVDGAAAATSPLKRFRLTRVFDGPTTFRGVDARTSLFVANPQDLQATVALTLYGGADGAAQLSHRTATLPAKGLLSGSVTDLFGLSGPVTNGSVEVSTTGEGAVGFELVECPGPGSLMGLGAAADDGSSTAYSAQLAAGGGYFTSIRLINTSGEKRRVLLHAVDDAGASLGSADVTLAAAQALEGDAAELLSLPIGKSVAGSLTMEADGSGIVGDVIFGDPGSIRFAAALPLQTSTVRQSIFSHVANGQGWFTGLALFNPTQSPATVTIEVYSPQGQKTGTPAAPLILGAGKRLSRLLTELVPAATGQMGGTVVVSSTQKLVSQEVFGDSGMTLLSAVPPSLVK